VKDSIQKSIVDIVSEISGVDAAEIKPETNFAKDLEVDSIKAIEITVAIEKKFRVSVRDEDVPNIITLHQAVELVTKLVEQKGLMHE
jgi:acyl carrier protein